MQVESVELGEWRAGEGGGVVDPVNLHLHSAIGKTEPSLPAGGEERGARTFGLTYQLSALKPCFPQLG